MDHKLLVCWNFLICPICFLSPFLYFTPFLFSLYTVYLLLKPPIWDFKASYFIFIFYIFYFGHFLYIPIFNLVKFLKLLLYWTYYSLLQGNGFKVYQGYQNTWLHRSHSQHSTSCASHLWIQLIANHVDCIYWKKKKAWFNIFPLLFKSIVIIFNNFLVY